MENTLDRWKELIKVVGPVCLSGSPDQPVWLLESSGKYSVKSFYKLINFGGIPSVIKNDIWKIKVPPNIHVFLWLVYYNKSLTRDNLAKRRHVEDMSCVFCSEPETIQHLFFDCIVARHVWDLVPDSFNVIAPDSFVLLASFWKKRKSCEALNIVTVATLWSLWRFRNDFVFQGRRWRSIRCVLDLLGAKIKQWKILCSEAEGAPLLRCLRLLDHRRGELLRLGSR